MKSSGEVKLFIGILAVALILVGFALFPRLLEPKPPEIGPPPPKPAPPEITRELLIPAGSHLRGDPNAPNSLVIFSDFQCPSCKSSVAATEEILKKHKGKINFVFHHYRVATQHVNSPILAQAAQAAGLQGKFWEMHDKLFNQQEAFSRMIQMDALVDLLAQTAGELKLDVLKFRDDIVKDRAKQFTDKDDALGAKIQITTTPTYYFVPAQGKPTQLHTTQQMADWINNTKNWETKAAAKR